MTFEEFLNLTERKVVGYVCPFCKNIVRIDEDISLINFIHLNTIKPCENCDESEKKHSVLFIGYKFLGKFVFSFSFPEEKREPEECYVDFESTQLRELPDQDCLFLEIKLKNLNNPEIKITFLLKKEPN